MNLTVLCHNDNDSWEASINDFQNYGSFYKANVTGRGSSIDLLFGSTHEYNWIALPIQEVATTLASFNDSFWNKGNLTHLIGETDAITVACALSYISQNILEGIPTEKTLQKKLTTHLK